MWLLLASGLWAWPPAGRALRPRRAWSRPRLPSPHPALVWVVPPGVAVLVGLATGLAAGVAAVLMSATVLALARGGWRRRRQRREEKTWSECVRALAREVRAGADPLTAVAVVGGVSAGAAAGALAELAAEMRWPGTAARSSSASEPARLLWAGWGLSRRHGVSWAVLLDGLAADLEERLRQDRERAAELAGPRLSGVVLALLPGLGLLLGVGMGAHPLQVLLQTPVGGVLLIAGTTLTCAGLGWTARIVRP